MFIPSLSAIKKFLPDAQFTFIYTNKSLKDVFEGTNIFDEYILLRKNIVSLIKIIFRVRTIKYDLIINSLFSSKNPLAMISLFSGARFKEGFVSSEGYQNFYGFVYNIPVKMKPIQHEIDRRLELAYALGVKENDIDKKPYIVLNKKNKQYAKEFFKLNNIKAKDKVISVNVGCSLGQRWKQWSIKKYAKLCDILLKDGFKIIIHGSPDEKEMIEDMIKTMDGQPIVAAGKTSTIKDAAAIIEKSDISISNDSGLMHVAVAVDTPVIAIYGPTDYERTAPLKHTIIREELDCSPCYKLTKVKRCPYDHKCFANITVDDVLKKVYEVIG